MTVKALDADYISGILPNFAGRGIPGVNTIQEGAVNVAFIGGELWVKPAKGLRGSMTRLTLPVVIREYEEILTDVQRNPDKYHGNAEYVEQAAQGVLDTLRYWQNHLNLVEALAHYQALFDQQFSQLQSSLSFEHLHALLRGLGWKRMTLKRAETLVLQLGADTARAFAASVSTTWVRLVAQAIAALQAPAIVAELDATLAAAVGAGSDGEADDTAAEGDEPAPAAVPEEEDAPGSEDPTAPWPQGEEPAPDPITVGGGMHLARPPEAVVARTHWDTPVPHHG